MTAEYYVAFKFKKDGEEFRSRSFSTPSMAFELATRLSLESLERFPEGQLKIYASDGSKVVPIPYSTIIEMLQAIDTTKMRYSEIGGQKLVELVQKAMTGSHL